MDKMKMSLQWNTSDSQFYTGLIGERFSHEYNSHVVGKDDIKAILQAAPVTALNWI